MKKCSFTIVAKNYIGLGLILEQYLQKFHKSDIDFYIFVADEIDASQITIPENVISVKKISDYTDAEWTDMTFKYDLTEFCTSIKPFCFQYIFSKGYDSALYFDPDICIFSPITEILEKLETYDVVLTPQVSGIHINYTGEHPEWAMNVNGIFNLGFCGMRKTPISQKILSWWRERLKNECFVDRSVGDFTDQKWMDWLPALLGNEHLYVIKNLGMNMAPWNYFERELFLKDGNIMVRFRTNDNETKEDQLVFLHFAGYDYGKMKQGIISRKRIENLGEYEDLKIATDIYMNLIIKNAEKFDKFLPMKYTYATYDNGDNISSFHRRLYHGLTLSGKNITNPFSSKEGTFYNTIKKYNMINNENIDKLTQRNIDNIGKKRKMIGIMFKCLYRFVGYKRYVLFVKSLYNYCRPELHTFLIDKK